MARASTKRRTQKRSSGLRKKGGSEPEEGEKHKVTLVFGSVNKDATFDFNPRAVKNDTPLFGKSWEQDVDQKRVKFTDPEQHRKLQNKGFMKANPKFKFNVTVPMVDEYGDTDEKKLELQLAYDEKEIEKHIPIINTGTNGMHRLTFMYPKKDSYPEGYQEEDYQGGRRRSSASKRRSTRKRSSKRRSGKKSVSKTAKRKL